MNPFNSYRINKELKNSFSLEQLEREDIYFSKNENKEAGLKTIQNFKDSIEFFVNQSLLFFEMLDFHRLKEQKFLNLARNYQNNKEIENFSDLLLDTQFFEAELLKLTMMLTYAHLDKKPNENYQRQLLNSVETLTQYFDKLNIDPIWFGTMLYKNINIYQPQYTDLIAIIRDKFIPVNCFFKNNTFHIVDNHQNINNYTPVYLMAFYNDQNGLASHFSQTKFSELNYLNVKNYRLNTEKHYFTPDISKELEKDILDNLANSPYCDVLKERTLLDKAFFVRHYDFVLPNKDICMLIHFSIKDDSAFKKAKDIDNLRKFYNNLGIEITKEKEALLLVNALHYQKPNLFKNWDWSAHDYLAIKEWFRLPKITEMHNELVSERAELIKIPCIEKQMVNFAKTLNYDEALELCNINISKHFSVIKTQMANSELVKVSKYLSLYFKPLEILIHNNKEKDKLNIAISNDLFKQLSKGVSKPDVVSLIEKNILNLSIHTQHIDESLNIKKRL